MERGWLIILNIDLGSWMEISDFFAGNFSYRAAKNVA